MSTKSKLLAVTENLHLPEVAPQAPPEAPRAAESENAPAAPPVVSTAPRFPPVTPGTAARTGPGQMLQFRGQMLAVEGELGKLRERLKEHEGSLPTRQLDPATVLPSRWANRHPDSFTTAAFASLKQDIELAGGNVQPIRVRPLSDRSGYYEVVFGHRRHRACSELGLPVLATIDTSAVSDLDLFAAMDRENRERSDLTPYEQGLMYRRALDEKMFPSNRRLAEALGVSHTWVANVLLVADLPPPVLESFRSPLEVQHRHAKALSAALEADRKGVLRRAEKLRGRDQPASPGQVVALLVGTAAPVPASASRATRGAIGSDGRQLGTWSVDRAGRLNLQVDASLCAGDALERLVKSLAEALAKHG